MAANCIVCHRQALHEHVVVHRYGDGEGEVEPVEDIDISLSEKESFGGESKLIDLTYMEPLVVLGFVFTACICIVCWMRWTDNKKTAAKEFELEQQSLEVTSVTPLIE